MTVKLQASARWRTGEKPAAGSVQGIEKFSYSLDDSSLHRLTMLSGLLTRLLALVLALGAGSAGAFAIDTCENKVYLTFNTGTMQDANVVADVLRRHRVRATFFASNARTQAGDGSLGNYWAPWWKARAAEGHEFASLTYDHVYWRGDLSGSVLRFWVRPSAGAFAGREFSWEPAKYCEQIAHAAQRVSDFTGKKSLPLFRAPGGGVSPALLQVARACGYTHVGWTPVPALADESNEKISDDALLQQALRDIRSDDILLATLGVPSRQGKWATAVLEPLLVGLRTRGFCFETLRTHASLQDWMATHGR